MEVLVPVLTLVILSVIGGSYYAYNTPDNIQNSVTAPVLETSSSRFGLSTETYSSIKNVEDFQRSTIIEAKFTPSARRIWATSTIPITTTTEVEPEPVVTSCPDITSDLTKNHVKSRCPLGTCSYELFKIIPPPRTPKCDVVRPIRLEPSDSDSSQLDVIKCKSIRCVYEAIEVRQFSIFELPFWNFLQQRLGKIKTVSITHDPATCDDWDRELPSNSRGVQLSNLEWLRFHDMNFCPQIHEAVESWNLPKLSLILFEDSFISNADSKHVSKMLRKNLASANVRTLILRNVSLCNKCDLFQLHTKFCALEQATLIWDNPNSVHVIQQTEIFLMSVTNLRGLEMNSEFSVSQIQKIAPELTYLEKIDFVITPNNNNIIMDDFNFSLESISQFQRLRDVIIRLKFKKIEDNIDSQKYIKVIDFDKIPATVKNITIFSQLPFSQVLDGRKFCDEKLIIEENTFRCERK